MALRDSDMAETIRKAQDSLPSFRHAIEAGTYPDAIPSVKAFIRGTEDSEGVHLWLGVKEFDEDGFICFPFEYRLVFKD
jgi:hypothetical protein